MSRSYRYAHSLTGCVAHLSCQTLYDLVTPHGGLSWQRVLVCNTLARTAAEWTSCFVPYNAGTYSNQVPPHTLRSHPHSHSFLGAYAHSRTPAHPHDRTLAPHSPAPRSRHDSLLDVALTALLAFAVDCAGLHGVYGQQRTSAAVVHDRGTNSGKRCGDRRHSLLEPGRVPQLQHSVRRTHFRRERQRCHGPFVAVLRMSSSWCRLPLLHGCGGLQQEKYGNEFSYYGNPRAEIFRRDAFKAVDAMSLGLLLRQNDWQNDPLSQGDPDNQIAARYGLRVCARTRMYACVCVCTFWWIVALFRPRIGVLALDRV